MVLFWMVWGWIIVLLLHHHQFLSIIIHNWATCIMCRELFVMFGWGGWLRGQMKDIYHSFNLVERRFV
jgi:hypothetical protein